MTYSADPDQLASSEPTDLDLHCLLRQGMLCLAREGLIAAQRYLIIRYNLDSNKDTEQGCKIPLTCSHFQVNFKAG